MKAACLHEFGGPEVLRYEDVPDPEPRKDQVLIRVKACALNHLDIWVRKGLPGVNLPHILAATSQARSSTSENTSPASRLDSACFWRPCTFAITVPSASRDFRISAASSPC